MRQGILATGGKMTLDQARLRDLAREYWRTHRAQERDHTDDMLNYLRSETHDVLLNAMRDAGILFEDREDAAQQALSWLRESY